MAKIVLTPTDYTVFVAVVLQILLLDYLPVCMGASALTVFSRCRRFRLLFSRKQVIRTMAFSSSSSSTGGGDAQFGQFRIPEDCIFHRTDASIAFVNLRPIVPGHVLVMPKKCVPHLMDLDMADYLNLWSAVRAVQEILEENDKQQQHDAAVPGQQYYQLGFNVAVQDGRAAGQSVPHVHVHILPRRAYDFERNDDVYTRLEEWAPRPNDDNSPVIKHSSLHVPDDADRRDRTSAEMASEAALYRSCRQRLCRS